MIIGLLVITGTAQKMTHEAVLGSQEAYLRRPIYQQPTQEEKLKEL